VKGAAVDDMDLLGQLSHPDARARRRALRELCPCDLKRNVPDVWQRVLAMVTDPDAKVRGAVLHTLCDGSPRAREAEVLRALDALAADSDLGVRRRARRVLSAHRRTGRVNVL